MKQLTEVKKIVMADDKVYRVLGVKKINGQDSLSAIDESGIVHDIRVAWVEARLAAGEIEIEF